MTAKPAFSRARSAEQRAERRAAILDTAAGMLADSRVADLSLNELARQVGLAKSNVLRYFESREAVLLELLGREYDEWLDAIEAALGRANPASPIERIADAVATTAAARPLLCELLASAALVLEHNVSADVAAAYKLGSIARATRLVRILIAAISVGEGVGDGVGDADGNRDGDEDGEGLDEERVFVQLAGGVNLAVGGLWGMCRPAAGMLAAYEKYPELGELRVDFEPSLREFVAVLLTGLIDRSRALTRGR